MTIMRRRAPEPYRPIGDRHPVHVATRVRCWEARCELRQTRTELILFRRSGEELGRWPLATVTSADVLTALKEAA